MTLATNKTICAIIFFGLMIRAYSQTTADSEYFNVFDASIGFENSEVYQGVLYKAQYRSSTDKNEFFKNQDFTKGSIVYNSQPYYNLDIKYDTYRDKVHMKLGAKVGGGTLVLFDEILQSFEMGNNRFVKIDSTNAPEISTHGFYKISSESSFLTLLTKFSKKDIRRVDKKVVYLEFVDEPNTFVLLHKGKYHKLNSKKDAKKMFPGFKTDIDKFYADVRRLRKSDPEGFKIALVNRMEILIYEQVNP